ncbi:hypothetical protein LY28_02958 [Ruminiclostridium sufflavum DSM 19573]|uniref:cellulase n=1 Tax=Ruminiclostridium sufflavum DSM 19573 TaxID=1121337 RepID=A0A318XH77_9FIRM|nr:dockerin type I domain-containing protein [Ruminiclostridium sufflavum]PYG86530.1 hypothetical protein LY28_02958 [Ruminiclostridium sufflavum DSM 19573]
MRNIKKNCLVFAAAVLISLSAPGAIAFADNSALANTQLAAVYENGQSYCNLSDFEHEVRVKLTDAQGNPLAGKKVEWKENSGEFYGLILKYNQTVTDSDGVAKNNITVMFPSFTKGKIITIDSAVSADFPGDTEYMASAGSVKVYRKLISSYKAGDGNMDGSVDALDLAALRMYLLGNKSAIINPSAVDMDNDRSLDAVDLALLKAILLR